MRLGGVVGAHGIRGELRVRVEGDALESWQHVSAIQLVRDDDGEEFEVLGVRAGRSGEVRVRLEGIVDRDAAESWRGAGVVARADLLPELPDGEFYAFQLVACRVFDTQGRALGTVREIWETGAHDVLVVVDEAGRDQLIPAVEPVLSRVDLAERRIEIDPPPGLLAGDDPNEEQER